MEATVEKLARSAPGGITPARTRTYYTRVTVTNLSPASRGRPSPRALRCEAVNSIYDIADRKLSHKNHAYEQN